MNIDRATVDIITTPLTDHNAVSISIPLHSTNPQVSRSAYWKLNYSLLHQNTVKTIIITLIERFWNKARAENAYSTNWELFKFKVGQYLRNYGSVLTKNRRFEEESVISKIMVLSQKISANLSEEERLELISEQSKLNDIHLK